MEITYQRSAIEAIGGGLDPQRLLQHATGILPDGWVPSPDLLQSSAVSHVAYAQHVDLFLREDRFRVMDLAEGSGHPPEDVAGLARSFLGEFERSGLNPHCASVIASFQAFVSCSGPAAWFVRQFIDTTLSTDPQRAKVTLVYLLDAGITFVSVEPAHRDTRTSDDRQPGVRISGVYLTYRLDGSALSLTECQDALGHAPEWRADFEQRVATLAGL